MAKKNIEDVYTLSPLQEGLLFHSLYAPESDAYLQHLRFSVRGALDVKGFEHAWQQLVARHAILRTAFVWDKHEKPLQVVRKQVSLPWQELDWRGLAPEELERRIESFVEEDRRRGLDLSKAPLLRMTVIRTADNAYELFCAFHHLLTDGWSTSLLIKELFVIYNAQAEGREPQLEQPRPYRDYIEWLRRQDMMEAELFWRETLKGFCAPTPLAGAPAPAGRADATDSIEIRKTWLSEETTAKLQAASRRLGVTLNTLVLGAWSLLLGRYSGEEDVLFGITVSGRPASLEGVEAMVGPFINTLPMRAQLPRGAVVSSWLGELQSRLLEVCEYSYSPLVWAQGFSDVPRGTPLFESMLVFENYPAEVTGRELSRHLESVQVRSLERSNYPLGLVAAPGPKLFLQLGYDSRRFTAGAIGRMFGHLETALAWMAENPSRRLSELSLLTEPERRQLLFDWNETAAEDAGDKCLHELFEEQVARDAQSVALIYDGGQLTYGELNERAHRLAQHLRALGVQAEARVGVCLERSPEMVISLLGILKAGGAYVPLDPGYPAERLRFMLEDARVCVLLTRESLLAGLSLPDGVKVVRADADWPADDSRGAYNLRAAANADNAAYVIYTSGSTGRPKGVLVTHRGIGNTLVWRRRTFSLGGHDRVLQNLSFAFDASVWQIFGGLISGAALVLADPEQHRDTAYLVNAIVEHGVTITDFPPSMLQTFLSEEGVENCCSLRHLFCGGEAMTPELQSRFHARLGSELHNVYGPTETSVDAACWTCAREGGGEAIPIGRPIANKKIHLLDDEMQPVPIGVAGEIYIGGEGLARGYLNRPELTAERFVPDPFSTEPGARLYRTGDVGRYLEDGAVEFIGRIDNQVKVRGFRIELGEIEAALSAHAFVRECVVAVSDDASGIKRLVAYVVAEAGAVVSPRTLRELARERLPEYMCPSAFVLLERLPLNPHGKIDRRALPAPTGADWQAACEFVAPRTEIEELLAGIWAEVLGVERVGVNDNFFDAGGHSLLATRVVSKVRAAFGVGLPLRALFEQPTIAELARLIESEMRGERGAQPAVVAAPRDEDPPMSYAQQRLWFLDRLTPDSAFYNLHEVYAVSGPLDAHALEAAFNQVVKRHEILRTTFAEKTGRLVQVVAPEMKLTLHVVDLEVVGGEAEAARLAKEDASRPFDLARGPLMRATLLRLGEGRHRLMLALHHIVTDGWSMGVLVREVLTLYRAQTVGDSASLPRLEWQYADFAHWQQSWLRGEALESELSYWRERLDAAPPALALPADRPRPPAQSFRGATYRFTLPVTLSRRLSEMGRREGATAFMTLLAAFYVLLFRYTGQQDLLVGTPVANRGRAEFESLVGLFVNTLVLRAKTEGGRGFRELLRHVREVCLGAYAHQDVPFEKLVEELHPERSLSHNPLFQVMFTADIATGQQPVAGDLSLSLVRTHEEAAKFDLTLSVVETEEGVSGAIEYSTDQFDGATIARMAEHYRNLIASALDAPDLPISRLPMLSAEESGRLLSNQNERAREVCVQQLFEEQVTKTPDAPALVCGPVQLTYAELNERANRLARHLRSLGVGAETRVGVLLERSPEAVVALLAVLKAGGAYVPLDAQYPRERLSFLLEDAGASVVLTEEQFSNLLTQDGPRVVRLDAERDEIARHDGENLGETAHPENAAYAIYTSGSTGRPKGVLVTHRALVNHNLAVASLYGLSAHDRVLQFVSLGFDVAAEELYPTLISGACVVLRDEEAASTVSAFLRFVSREALTVLNLPTPFWHEWVAALDMEGDALPESLRLVVIGSDRASVQHYDAWRRAVGDRLRLVNAYGPTEATITATAHEAGGEDVWDAVPVGRAIAGASVYVLDAEMQPVPFGVAGEVYIGGCGLARGYLNRPALTAERFVPHPFSDEPGARLYRTGDLGRLLEDGGLKIVGRLDEQVKVRGFRVELGEVEAALAAHASVRDAVVVATGGESGDRRLIAYVSAASGVAAPSTAELRSYMKERLPEYMIPSAFAVLDELPLTPNGKVDRRHLPPPPERAAERDDYVAPRDFVELPLVKIWKEVLGVERVGVTDDFFELGGHSILALRLMAEIKSQFGRELPLTILFERGTIEQLAKALRRQFTPLPDSPVVTLQAEGARRPLFFVHVGSGQVLCYLELAKELGPEQPFYGLQDTSLNAVGRLRDTPIEEMAAYYVDSLRAVQPEGPYLLGGWSFGGLVAYEMARQLVESGEEVPLLFLLDTATPEFIRGMGAEDDTSLLGILAREMGLEVADEELRSLSPDEQLQHVCAQMERKRLVFDNSLAYLTRQLEIFKSRVRVMNEYDPKPYNGTVVFYSAGGGDDAVSVPGVAVQDATRGFGELCRGRLELLTVPGAHNEMARGEGARILAGMLSARIDLEARKEPDLAKRHESDSLLPAGSAAV